jgi:uncharacterized protein
MKFIADVMLGRLAKHLRLLGLDVLYNRTLDDNELIRRSLEESRTILTRDTGLVGRPLAADHIFIATNDLAGQIREVLDSSGLDGLPLPLTRCSECNEPLAPVPREEARDLVPDYVYEKNEEFLGCRKCGRIYWKGTHTKRMAFTAMYKK